MNYYQFHIGDYASHTRHLTLMENLAYRLLLDLYYLHERPLNSGSTSVARQIGMRDHEEEVLSVLQEFFILTDDGWINKRADLEIGKYREKAANASKAGKASASKRAFNTRSTDVQPTNNHKPITNNHIKPKATATPLPVWLPVDEWNNFLECRKKLKSPMTERAKQLAIKKLEQLMEEGNKPIDVLSQSIYSGWKGLFPVKQEEKKNGSPAPQWWTTDQGVIDKGRSIGLEPRPGETMSQFRGRIQGAA